MGREQWARSNRLLTVDDLAGAGISARSQIYRLATEAHLPVVTIGRYFRFSARLSRSVRARGRRRGARAGGTPVSGRSRRPDPRGGGARTQASGRHPPPSRDRLRSRGRDDASAWRAIPATWDGTAESMGRGLAVLVPWVNERAAEWAARKEGSTARS